MPQLVALLLEGGATLNLGGSLFSANVWLSQDEKGCTILHRALTRGYADAVVRTIVEAEPQLIRTKSQSNELPVEIAVANGSSLELLTILL